MDVPMAPSHALYYVGAYLFVAVCLVAPPPAIQSMGLTVQAVFENVLGSPHRNCLGYHVKYVNACEAGSRRQGGAREEARQYG